MASSPYTTQNSSVASSSSLAVRQQRRRNGALSCAECRRFVIYISVYFVNLAVVATQIKAQVRNIAYSEALFLIHAYVPGVVAAFLAGTTLRILFSGHIIMTLCCSNCVKKGCGAICPDGMYGVVSLHSIRILSQA